jgi:hypothetical protein
MLGEAPKPWACGVIITHTSPGSFVRGTAAGLVVYEPCCNPICHLTVTAGAHLPSSCFIFVALATVHLFLAYYDIAIQFYLTAHTRDLRPGQLPCRLVLLGFHGPVSTVLP